MLFKQNTRPDHPATKSPTACRRSSLATTCRRASCHCRRRWPSAPRLHPRRRLAPAGPDESEGGKRLIVGAGIQLKGEITACDRLVVEGQVEVTMNATRTLEIKPSGHFIGSCEVEEADVSGSTRAI